MSAPQPALVFKFDTTSSQTSIDTVRLLSHELRQPLSAIESIAYYLQLVLPHDDSQVRQQLDKLPSLVEQIDWILNDALHFFRILPSDPQILDLHELVTDAVAEKAGDEPPHFELDFPDGEALVSLDWAQGRHLLRSLISLLRRLDHVPGRISIRTRVSEGRVDLEFFLPGVQYNAEQLQRMFEPFQAGSPAGSGLTLATARRIMEAHGGRISVKSETGLGTSLTGELPLAV